MTEQVATAGETTAPDVLRLEADLPEPLTPLFDPDPEALSRLRDSLVGTAADAGILDIAYRTLDTPVGSLLLAATAEGVIRVAFDNEDHDLVLVSLAQQVSPRIMLAPGRLDCAARQIDGVLRRRENGFRASVGPAAVHRVPPRRAGPPAGDRLRPHRELCPGRGRHRQPAGGPGGRLRMRHQSAATVRAVPSGGAFGRHRSAAIGAARRPSGCC